MLSAAARKKAKKATAAAQSTVVGKEIETKIEEQPDEVSKKDKRRAKLAEKEAKGPSLVCNVCKQSFESKSKLFKHINTTGHALHV